MCRGEDVIQRETVGSNSYVYFHEEVNGRKTTH
jgi:hypothetical protein